MERTRGLVTLEPKFDGFLFASLGEDTRGMPVSVLSALARSDVDPWQEAARLASLPAALATSSLASTISAFPDRLVAPVDLGEMSSRLVRLLPRPAIHIDRIHASSQAQVVSPTQATRYAAAIVAILLVTALIFGMDYLAAGHHIAAQPQQHTHHGPGSIAAQKER